ncbi:MAG: GumC family protein, partial [Ginsengibacter sp.]
MQTSNHKLSEEVEDNFFQQLVSKYVPYWPMFLAAIAIAGGIAYTYLRYTVPLYEAKATILIKDEKKGNEDSKLMESLDQISSKKIVENEIEVIQSRTLMINVAKALSLYAPIYEKGNVLTTSAYIKSPVTIESPNPDSLKETGKSKIYLSYNKSNQTVVLNNKYRYALNEIVNTPYGTLKFIPNKYFDSSDTATHQLFFTLVNPKNIAAGLLTNLKAEPSGKLSSVVDLSYRDEVPQRAEDILNQLIEAYDQSTINEKDKLARNTLAFVEDRLSLVAHDLDSIEKKVQQYKSDKGAVDVGTQAQLYLQNVSGNDQKLSEVNMQLSVLNQVQKFVTNKDNSSAIVPSTLGVSDPLLSSLLDKLYNSELEYERLKKTVGENNPTLVAVTDQINKIKPNILQNIQSQQQSLNAAKQNLYSTNGSYNSILQSVPQKERQLLDISREQETKR